MARIRSLKPESFTSLSLSDVDRGVRWTFAGLWTYCDDDGRAVWDARLVKAAIYPADDNVSAAVVSDDVAELCRIDAVCLYEVGGKSYLHVPSFTDHQHPNRKVASKLPPCPGSTETGHVQQHVTAMPGTTHSHNSEPAVSNPAQLTPVVVVVEERSVGGDVGVAATEVDDTASATRPPTHETTNQRAQRLAKHYTERVPLSRFPAVLGIVRKACDAEKTDAEIIAALVRLAQEGRSLTVETLRIEIEGQPPPSRQQRRTTDDKVRDGLDLARRLADEANTHTAPAARQIGA